MSGPAVPAPANPGIRMDAETVGDMVVVTLREARLDATAAVAFRQRIAELTDGGARTLVLDMSAVEVVDPSGLGALISVRNATRANAALALCGLRPSAAAAFRLTRLDKLFRIFADPQEARAALTERPGGAG